MKTLTAVLLIIIALIAGFAVGMGYGVSLAMDKAIYAGSVLFDIKMSPYALQIASQFPELLKRFTLEERAKLGLNMSDVKQLELSHLNQTMTAVNKVKYPSLSAGEEKP